jgi:hypothetical protein
MTIPWWRARLDGSLDPFLLRPFLYVCFAAIAFNTAVAIGSVLLGVYWQASAASFAIVATFYVLMRGLHDAEQLARWRDRVEREHDAVLRAAAARFPLSPRGRE